MALKAIDGLPIMDAKKPLVLKINENDINKADRKEPADCAVARACRRDLHVKEVRVHLGRVYLRQNAGNWLRYMTPRALRSEPTFALGRLNAGAHGAQMPRRADAE